MPRRSPGCRGLVPERPLAGGDELRTDAFARELAAALAASAPAPGTLLPPERQLAAAHRVGRITVRRGLQRLAQAGLIACRPRVGYVVVDAQAEAAGQRPIGLVYADPDRAGAASRMISAFERLLARSGRALLVGSSGLQAVEEDRCLQRFLAAGLAGLIIAPAIRGRRSAELERWIGSGRPTVLCGHPGRWLLPERLAAACDQVDLDNRGGVRLALDHLRALGHERIAFATSAGRHGSERVAAFREHLSAAGRTEADWLLTGLDNSLAGGEAAGARLGRSAGRRPTAFIVAGSEEIALGLLAAGRSLGLACPRDFSLICFGENRDHPAGGDLARLSRLEAPQEAEAILALLQEQMRGERSGGRCLRVPVVLVERGSSGPAA